MALGEIGMLPVAQPNLDECTAVVAAIEVTMTPGV